MEITIEYLQTLVCERYRTDERYRRGHLNIIAAAPGTKVLGLHTPEMKMVAKSVVKDGSWREDIERYASSWPLTGEAGLAMIDAFLPAIDSWEICDNFCCNSKWAQKVDKEALWKYLVSLFHSGQPWSIRVATILAMCHYLGPEDIASTFQELEKIGFKEGEPYYVRMGVAWMLATALARNQQATLDYVHNCHLPSDMLKLYVRKARESRITREVKAF